MGKGLKRSRYLGKKKWLVIVNRCRVESGMNNKKPTTQLEVNTTATFRDLFNGERGMAWVLV